jgi:multidrug efflux system outer membrane protein
MSVQRTVVFVGAVLLSGCAVGPNYQRPQIPIPQSFRAAPPSSTDSSFADMKWWEIFKDPVLQDLERTALAQNYDLRDAVARVEAARANVGIVRSQQFPNLAGAAEISTTRISRDGAQALPPSFLRSQDRTFGSATLELLSFEVDIWGRLRRATEASRAQLLSAEETRKAVLTTLVSEVATDYFNLRELDYELEISQRTLGTRRASLDLVRNRQAGGVATLLDLRQAEQLVYSASATIPVIQLDIEQTENSLRLLLGESPSAVPRGRGLTEQDAPPDIPAGLPSALLERRPDILAAEQNLIAANAEIGVAKAAYFPQISLSGYLGGQGNQLSSLFSSASGVWNFTPQVTQPIFTAGRLKSTVRLTEAQRQSAVTEYEKAIQTSFTEVSNALIAHQRTRESRIEQEQLVATLVDRTRLAYVRYRGGVDTQLNALDADRDQFEAELSLAQIRRNELLSVVTLYKALGGGWQ